MASSTSTTRGRLTEQRIGEVYAGVLDLLVEVGYDNLTLDAVAQRTSSSKATLYRQWGGKTELVAEALQCHGDEHHDALTDTGTLAGDLRAWTSAKGTADARENNLLLAVVRACSLDDELAASLRGRLMEQGRSRLGVLVARAVDRGELAADHPALPFLITVLAAPFLLRHILDGEDVTATYLRSYVDAVVLPALGVA